MAQDDKAKILVEGLSKSFGGKTVLDDVSMAVPAGSKTVLIGPAASGKTVLMKCLAGIYPHDGGSIAMDGTRIAGKSDAERAKLMLSVGVVFQQGGLFDSLPVWKNITFKLRNSFGIGEAEARKVTEEKLGQVNLPASTADLLPSQLSGGMQKRVGIARALAGDPSLLLLDEPTAGLDPITTSVINRLIDKSIEKTGATVLAITSDMASAMSDYEHMVMLNEGRVVWSGKVADVATSGNDFVQQLTAGRAEGPIKMRVKARA